MIWTFTKRAIWITAIPIGSYLVFLTARALITGGDITEDISVWALCWFTLLTGVSMSVGSAIDLTNSFLGGKIEKMRKRYP